MSLVLFNPFRNNSSISTQLHNVSGHRTFSDNPRIIYNLRILGLLALAALGVTIAGGILGTHVAPNQGNIGFILRRVGSGIYGGIYILLVLVHIGAWTYRWHLKSYRRRVGKIRLSNTFSLTLESS